MSWSLGSLIKEKPLFDGLVNSLCSGFIVSVRVFQISCFLTVIDYFSKTRLRHKKNNFIDQKRRLYDFRNPSVFWIGCSKYALLGWRPIRARDCEFRQFSAWPALVCPLRNPPTLAKPGRFSVQLLQLRNSFNFPPALLRWSVAFFLPLHPVPLPDIIQPKLIHCHVSLQQRESTAPIGMLQERVSHAFLTCRPPTSSTVGTVILSSLILSFDFDRESSQSDVFNVFYIRGRLMRNADERLFNVDRVLVVRPPSWICILWQILVYLLIESSIWTKVTILFIFTKGYFVFLTSDLALRCLSAIFDLEPKDRLDWLIVR